MRQGSRRAEGLSCLCGWCGCVVEAEGPKARSRHRGTEAGQRQSTGAARTPSEPTVWLSVGTGTWRLGTGACH